MPEDEQEERRRRARSLFEKAYEHQLQGKLDDAEALYKQSIEVEPTAEAYTFLGWTYSFKGRYDEAIAQCRRAIAVDPTFGNPYNDIGAYLIEKGELDEAVPWLEKATQAIRYDSYCFPHLNLGRIWERKGLWYKAMDSYNKALEANPNYTLAIKALARIRGLLN